MTDILLLGFGTIAHDLLGHLEPELARGEVRVHAAVVRDLDRDRGEKPTVPLVDAGGFDAALSAADVVVECAGVPAAREYGPRVIASGTDLLLASVGALADRDVRQGLLAGPGRLAVTNGAIGGFDLLGAAAQSGGLDAVSIQTSKLARALVQPWMDDAERATLESLQPGDAPIEIFVGSPSDAIAKFPANVNVAVALAWATREFLPRDASVNERVAALDRAIDRVQVRILADPDAALSTHVIRARGDAGEYEFRFRNAPSPTNPRTSGTTAMSVVRDLRELLAKK